MHNTKPLNIGELEKSFYANREEVCALDDFGRRRYRPIYSDFDGRANFLSIEIKDDWKPETKSQWTQNKSQIQQGILEQFGSLGFDQKLKNFMGLGSKSSSILSYHNAIMEQIRVAFVSGSYYPALTGACALGERILNHLILDLRQYFKSSPEYRNVHNKSSIADWTKAIDILDRWEILLPEVSSNFHKLKDKRHRSLHFNPETYNDLRESSLDAILTVSSIIERQFGTFGTQPWFIPGVPGVSFIKKSYEDKPFIRHFFVPQCPFVGVYHSLDRGEDERTVVLDFLNYGHGDLSDEEFGNLYKSRDPAKIPKLKDLQA